MLTIERCDNIHVHLPQQGTILSEAIAAALRQAGAAGFDGTVQTFATLHEAPPALGEVWSGQGGRYAGTMPARGDKPGYHLVRAASEQERIKFGPYERDVAGARDHYDGLANTNALTEAGLDHTAAGWSRAVSGDGHDDFYLPAHNELMLMWICVPHLFEKGGYYWSSTQHSPSGAWVQDFEGGSSRIYGKTFELRAVAVRRLVI